VQTSTSLSPNLGGTYAVEAQNDVMSAFFHDLGFFLEKNIRFCWE